MDAFRDDHEEFWGLRDAVGTDYYKPDHMSTDQMRIMCSDYENGAGYKLALSHLLQLREQMILHIHHCSSSPPPQERTEIYFLNLLLQSASSIHQNSPLLALESLTKLYQNVCLTGDSVQRLLAYFADGLLLILTCRNYCSPLCHHIMKNPSRDEQFLAFAHLYQVSPFYQFAHFTSNQAILETFERDQNQNIDINKAVALHVIDFDIGYGFQWPSLMQSLSEKATPSNPITFKLTGFGPSFEELQQTESRLANFAKSFRNRLVFEFQGSVLSDDLSIEINPKVVVQKKKNETVAINLVLLHLNPFKYYTSSQISETLIHFRSLRPSIVTLVEQERSKPRNSTDHSFVSRLVESIDYFGAMFDSLDECLPLNSAERLSIEKHHLGREIKSELLLMMRCNANNDENSCPRLEKMETSTWKEGMESSTHGFCGVKLSPKCVMQAKLLLKMRTQFCPTQYFNGGFSVLERDGGKALSLGRRQSLLMTASSWCCM